MSDVLAELKGRDFLCTSDYTNAQVQALIDLAVQLKAEKKAGKPHHRHAGKHVAIYFEKPSNRTRVSFEVGIADLGAHPIHLRKEEINLGVRETIADTARTLSRYVDGIMIRTFAHQDAVDLAEYATVPVINGLTDDLHPCQVMADLLTIQERLGAFKGRKLTYIGDGNNMAHSLMLGGAQVGMDVTIACPKDYQPLAGYVEKAQAIGDAFGARMTVTDDIEAAARDASVLYTDVWASMGQESEAEARRKHFEGYQVNDRLLTLAKPEAIVLHCLPAHRGEEITEDVLERFADVIFDEAENRLHAQKAVMAAIL
ncbi:MAG: ornithine carbamoyltransferase [Candidatus Melainabacteria bacterium]